MPVHSFAWGLSQRPGFLHFAWLIIIHTGPCIPSRNDKRVRIQCHGRTSLLLTAVISSQPRGCYRRRWGGAAFWFVLLISCSCVCDQMPWTGEGSVELLHRLQLHELGKCNHHPHCGDHRYCHLTQNKQFEQIILQINSSNRLCCLQCMSKYIN